MRVRSLTRLSLVGLAGMLVLLLAVGNGGASAGQTTRVSVDTAGEKTARYPYQRLLLRRRRRGRASIGALALAVVLTGTLGLLLRPLAGGRSVTLR